MTKDENERNYKLNEKFFNETIEYLTTLAESPIEPKITHFEERHKEAALCLANFLKTNLRIIKLHKSLDTECIKVGKLRAGNQ